MTYGVHGCPTSLTPFTSVLTAILRNAENDARPAEAIPFSRVRGRPVLRGNAKDVIYRVSKATGPLACQPERAVGHPLPSFLPAEGSWTRKM